MSALPRTIDLMHLGNEKALGAHLHDGWLIDPGPQSTLETLLPELDGVELKGVLLTHIHFDHAGASGSLVERFPDLEVWVHERGAKHMIDPTRLVASARGVFGPLFDVLWGDVVPLPEKNVRVLSGGETIGDWRIEYTPGHASHHVCYLHESTGAAFVGDVAGIRIDGGPAMPPTPPPDIDPPLWKKSVELVESWQPESLALMHFGVYTDVAEHLATMHESLELYSETSRTMDADGMARAVREWVDSKGHPGGEATYAAMHSFDVIWAGLQRYWKKQAQ